MGFLAYSFINGKENNHSDIQTFATSLQLRATHISNDEQQMKLLSSHAEISMPSFETLQKEKLSLEPKQSKILGYTKHDSSHLKYYFLEELPCVPIKRGIGFSKSSSLPSF